MFERAQAGRAAAGRRARGRRAAPSGERLRSASCFGIPNSGYCDNALWQAAAAARTGLERSRPTPHDRDEAVEAFTWLAREYPASPLARQAAGARDVARTAAPTDTPSPAPAAVAEPRRSRRRSRQRRRRRHAVLRLDHPRATLPRGDRLTVELSDEVAVTPATACRTRTASSSISPTPSAAAAVAEQVARAAQSADQGRARRVAVAAASRAS